MNDESTVKRCELCTRGPSERQGHDDLVPRLDALGRTVRNRRWLTFECERCATRWARHRVAAGQFEWKRVA